VTTPTRRVVLALGTATLLGHGAVSAQGNARTFRIGILSPAEGTSTKVFDGFREGLRQLGYVEGENIAIDYRLAAGYISRLPAMASELVRLSVDVIVADGSKSAQIAHEATRTIPIIGVAFGPDPVAAGLANSFAHPGGNITGFASYDAEIIGKWIELLKEAVPALARVAIIFNPDTATDLGLDRVIQAARPLGVTATRAPVHNDAEIVAAISAVAREPGGGLVALPDSFNQTHHAIIIDTAIRHGLPLASVTGFTGAGALISYWFNGIELLAPAAGYIDRILRGASPANLPVQYPTKYQLIINLKTAHALGLTIPPSLLQLADELIE